MTKSYNVGSFAIGLVLLAFAVLTFLPFYYVVLTSISDPLLVREGQLLLWPKGFDLTAYQIILHNDRFVTSFINTINRTFLGITTNLALQLSFAYALSKRYLPGQKLFMLYIIITMLFNGGIIPTYLIVKGTGLIDTIWALVIPSAISTWNVILLKSFFENVPASLEESAKIDGANDWTIFYRIYLPLSTASVATIGLFVAVHHWNTYMDAVVYINSTKLQVLQIFLRDMVVQLEMAAVLGDVGTLDNTSSLSVRTASIFLVALPVIIVYPFIQRYFVKGVMLGAVKG
ncbi:Inner membrane ABC transporter permease protein YcjP [Paenibacillus konkukensis]|uniref:Inner membrane ABC transporter permease protein YcjP n=1 Tax=Paenibacillus konkukensis TaxID=2020716 RepID=A0ABY4RJ79_9BACL|nr:carbohydrate ABC transporter permease [Paenibacillus konkukensis]UQZ82486.1 Inner membrane ABC transporter permease protein YcjP [Paenibacillus konkukensis]